MTNLANDSARSGWFKLLVSFLAITTVNLLFWQAGLVLFKPSFFSAQTLIFCLSWFALERGYAVVILFLLSLRKPAQRAQQ